MPTQHERTLVCIVWCLYLIQLWQLQSITSAEEFLSCDLISRTTDYILPALFQVGHRKPISAVPTEHAPGASRRCIVPCIGLGAAQVGVKNIHSHLACVTESYIIVIEDRKASHYQIYENI